MRTAGGKKPPSYGELAKIVGRSRHTVRRACQYDLRQRDAARKRNKQSKLHRAHEVGLAPARAGSVTSRTGSSA